jgi:hypothetical protein
MRRLFRRQWVFVALLFLALGLTTLSVALAVPCVSLGSTFRCQREVKSVCDGVCLSQGSKCGTPGFAFLGRDCESWICYEIYEYYCNNGYEDIYMCPSNNGVCSMK